MNKVHTIGGLIILLIIYLFSGCKSKEDINVPEKPEMTGLARPVMLQPDSTVIVLSDYFLHPKALDSLFLDKSFSFRISADSMNLTIFAGRKSVPKLSVMTAWIDGFGYSLLLEKSRKLWHHVEFDPEGKNYKKVQMAGEMNDWNPAKTFLKLTDGTWQTDLLLNPGKYQYQLVLEGKWELDPGNPESVDNNVGGFNSVMKVGSIYPAGAPFLYTDKIIDDKVSIGVKQEARDIFVFWQNYLLDNRFWKTDSNRISIIIPGKARQFERSFLRVWASNASGSSNEILIPLQNGKVIRETSDLDRTDKEAMIIYFLMVDRFRNGNPANDGPLNDSEVDPKLNFQGGDLEGITSKISDGYFSDLGINTIWISPITQNPFTAWREYPPPHRKFSGYHGYWPVTLTTVDIRFGTPDDMKKLVEEAHGKNINILLDYVSNHVHQESPIYKQHPDWATPFILPDKRKNLRLWDEQRLTTWFDEFLPTLDLSKPEVYNLMSDSALFWIREYKLDGFRHDATKHIPEVYWRTLTRKINEQVVIPEKRSVYQVGETYGSRELIRSYINPGELDGQFDFSLYFNARTIFARDKASFKDLHFHLQESFNYFGEHSLMGNITGNQDQARFISLASGALNFGEEDREVGWKRDIGVKDTAGYNKLASLLAFNMTIPGIPVIYYGDEYGMPGANDPDNRRMMKFDSLDLRESRMKTTAQKLIHLRNSSMPLIYGDFTTIEVSDKIFVYMRSYFDKVVFVIFNKDRSSRKIAFNIPERFKGSKLTSDFGNDFTIEKNKITLNLKGNSFGILTN